MSDLIDTLVTFTRTHPGVIPNLRAAHQPGSDGYCRACPSGTPHGECPFLRLVDAVEARAASSPSTPAPVASDTAQRPARAGARS